MQALRPALRRQLLWRTNLYARPTSRITQPLRRWQHEQYGPHKEYFQTPGQSPLPDTTPYHPGEQIYTAPTDNEPSRFNRALRSLGWLALFSFIGSAAGQLLNTWEYMQPPNEPGSPEEQEILEEIEFMMQHNSVAGDLREQGYIEEDFYIRRPGAMYGSNLVHDTLRGSSQGLSIKTFRNPKTNYTFVTFFVGFGMDGWPDVMHGGITATMVLEAAARHFSYFWSDHKLKQTDPQISIDYKKPIRPGEVYTIMLPPATIGPMKEDPRRKTLNCMACVLRTDSAPKITVRVNPMTGITEHTVEVMSAAGIDPNMAMATVRAELEPSRTVEGDFGEVPCAPDLPEGQKPKFTGRLADKSPQSEEPEK